MHPAETNPQRSDQQRELEVSGKQIITFINKNKARAALIKIDIDPNRSYTKAELRERGYIFYNRVGEGSRTIIRDITDEDGQELELLTTQQVDQHVRTNLPPDFETSNLHLMAKDMGIFITLVQKVTAATDALNPESRLGSRYQNDIMAFIKDLESRFPAIKGHSEIARLSDYYERLDLVSPIIDAVKKKYHLPTEVRGIPIARLARRGEGLGVAEHACPHLECDHVFSATDGIKIFDDGTHTGTKGQIRINPITVHLARHGISNTKNQELDRDHRYITLSEYAPLFDRRQPEIETKLLQIDYKALMLEILTTALQTVVELVELSTELSSEEVEIMAKEYLFIE